MSIDGRDIENVRAWSGYSQKNQQQAVGENGSSAGDATVRDGQSAFRPGSETFSGRPIQSLQRGTVLPDAEQIRAPHSLFVADRADIMKVSRVLGETFSDPRPTNTTIICGFAEEEMKVELEVTALKRGR